MDYQLLSEQQEEIINAYKQAFEIITKCTIGMATTHDALKLRDYGRLIRDAKDLAEMNIEEVEREMHSTGTFSNTPLS